LYDTDFTMYDRLNMCQFEHEGKCWPKGLNPSFDNDGTYEIICTNKPLLSKF